MGCRLAPHPGSGSHESCHRPLAHFDLCLQEQYPSYRSQVGWTEGLDAGGPYCLEWIGSLWANKEEHYPLELRSTVYACRYVDGSQYTEHGYVERASIAWMLRLRLCRRGAEDVTVAVFPMNGPTLALRGRMELKDSERISMCQQALLPPFGMQLYMWDQTIGYTIITLRRRIY